MTLRLPALTVRRRGAAFHYPGGERPRTIVLSPGFEPVRGVSCVRGADELRGWSEADALAGTLDELRAAAATSLTVKRGIVVFTHSLDSCIADADRDFLWHRFGVPVFEQYLNAHNELLATECDAHAGLHIVAEWGGLARNGTDADPCPCGDPRPLLVTPKAHAAVA